MPERYRLGCRDALHWLTTQKDLGRRLLPYYAVPTMFGGIAFGFLSETIASLFFPGLERGCLRLRHALQSSVRVTAGAGLSYSIIQF
jgi:hypothetical protein